MCNDKRKFYLAKILFGIHIEKNHRYIFDNLYVQKYVIKKSDRKILIYYRLLTYLFNDFRPYLKLHKIELEKIQCKNIWQKIAYKKLLNVNVIRYSDYVW